MIQVLAILTTKPGQRAEVLRAFERNVNAVRAEAGCIEYFASVDAEGFGALQAAFGADTFVVIEKWESADALRAHTVAPHMKAYSAAVKDMIETRTIHVLKPVE